MSQCTTEGCRAQACATKNVCLKCYKRAWARTRRGSRVERVTASDRERLGISDVEWSAFKEARERGYKRAGYYRNREELKERVLQRKTQWTKAQVLEALAMQNGRCAICPREIQLVGAPHRAHAVHRDHYETLGGARCPPHTPGATRHRRALLCGACNSGLGYYEAPNGPRAAGLRIDVYENYITRFGG